MAIDFEGGSKTLGAFNDNPPESVRAGVLLLLYPADWLLQLRSFDCF